MQNNSITEAVIVLGGMGTRLLPYTKTVSKEMLPIYDVPSVFLLVKEAYLSGIRKIIFVVTKKNKDLIKNFFTQDKALMDFIKGNPSKIALVHEVNEIISKMTFVYVYQKIRGTYGALYSARKHIKNDNFIVMYGDDLVDNDIPLTRQLINEFEHDQKMYVAVREYNVNELPNSGVVKLDKENYFLDITKKENGSNVLVHGRMLLNKCVFDIKDQLQYYENNELYLPHSLLLFKGQVKGFKYQGEYFNIGEKLGFIKASIHYALKDQKQQRDLLMFIKEIK